MHPSSGYEGRYEGLLKTVIFIAASAAVALRYPRYLTEPRFWAEEGKVYFAYAYNHGWLDSLIAPHQGYYSLYPNLSTLLAARLVPLEYAPHVTTLMALFVQILPFHIVLWGNAPVWGPVGRRAMAVLLILLTPVSSEVWLSTITSQFHFSLITFLIFMELKDGAAPFILRRWYYRLLVLFAGLTGAVSLFFTPVFAWLALKERKKEQYIHLGILLLCAVAEAAAIAASSGSGNVSGRLHEMNPELIPYMAWLKVFIGPLLGPGIADGLARAAGRWLIGTGPAGVWSVGTALALAFASVFFIMAGRARIRPNIAPFAAFALLFVFSVLFALGNKFCLLRVMCSPRYFYVPAVAFWLIIAVNLEHGGLREFAKSYRSVACGGLIAVVLAWGGLNYFGQMSRFTDPGWTDWKDEVEISRDNPGYLPRTWPQWPKSDWRVDLYGSGAPDAGE